MRVGIRDAERLKDSRLPHHPSGLRPCPPTPSGLQPSPPVRGSRPSPLWGEGFCAAQIGGDWSFCGTFGYIYWELWRSAPVGEAGGPVCRPYKRGGGNLPPHPPQCAHWGTFPQGGRLKNDKKGQVPLSLVRAAHLGHPPTGALRPNSQYMYPNVPQKDESLPI